MASVNNKNLKVLLSFGAIGSALFVITFLCEGALRNDYSSWKYPVSSLSIGKYGWIQKINFIISGSLILIFAAALRKTLLLSDQKTKGAFHIGLVGLGLTCAGIFTTDPIYGYPEDQSLILSQFTIQGHLHDLFSLFVFVCLPISCFVFRKQFTQQNKRSLALYSIITAIIMILAFIIAAIGFKQYPLFVNSAGFFQRISIISSCIWIIVISIHFFANSFSKSDDNHTQA